LIKACGDDNVSWDGTSIIISKEIRVDPSYGEDNCSIIPNTSGTEGSLVRVKKIVGHS